MTPPALLGVSVTTVGHAETGRAWQARDFWRRADTALGGTGDLLRMYTGSSLVTSLNTGPVTSPLPRRPQENCMIVETQVLYAGVL